MVKFILKKDTTTKLFSVYENGVKVKNPIFISREDFEQELKLLGFNKPYSIEVLN